MAEDYLYENAIRRLNFTAYEAAELIKTCIYLSDLIKEDRSGEISLQGVDASFRSIYDSARGALNAVAEVVDDKTGAWV